jgi:hypothetical protein
MWRSFGIVAAILASLACLLVWASASATFLYQHPRTAGLRVEIDKRTGAAVVVRPVSATGNDNPAPRPILQADETQYDFGTMDPLTMGRHEFRLKNAGNAPLALQVGSTTCKCTLAGLAKNELAPGEETTVALEWNSGRHCYFQHFGTIYTSDPKRRSLDLQIKGRVIATLGCDVAEVVVPPITPGDTAATEFVVFSQVWDRFEIAAAGCDLAGVTLDVSPLDPAAANALEAKSARLVHVSVPCDLASGEFRSAVHLSVAAPGESKRHVLDLPLVGTVLPRLSLLGGQADAYGNIHLGSLREGEGKSVRLLVKVRDPEARLDAAKVTATPEFLQARLEPRAESRLRGLYDLVIELPADAPVCQYLGNPRGQVRLDSGHSRLGSAAVGVTFSIRSQR